MKGSIELVVMSQPYVDLNCVIAPCRSFNHTVGMQIC